MRAVDPNRVPADGAKRNAWRVRFSTSAGIGWVEHSRTRRRFLIAADTSIEHVRVIRCSQEK